MTKIYIDSSLTPRYSATGWPSKKSFVDYENDFHVELYDEALAKAKADSIPFELPIYAISGDFMEMDLKPDTFVEVEIGDVEVVRQVKYLPGNTSWVDVPIGPGTIIVSEQRTIARLKKPENAGNEYSEGAEIDDPFKLEDFIKKLVRGFYGIGAVGWAPNPDTDFETAWKRYLKDGIIPEWRTHCSDWKEKMPLSILSQNLEQQLAAANKRIAELEQWKSDEMYIWLPIITYCQDDKNARRLGIGLGQRISTRVLEILKGIK